MIGLVHVYWLAGLFISAVALRTASDASHPRRWSSAVFWGLLAAGFLAGDSLPSEVMGLIVILLAAIAGGGGLRAGVHVSIPTDTLRRRAVKLGHRLLLPVLLVSVMTVCIVLSAGHLRLGQGPLVSPVQTTVIALGISCAVALLAGWAITRAAPREVLAGGHRLLETIGWAALLPLLLAVLGGVFSRAGVGEILSGLFASGLPPGSRVMALVAYASGMALLTMVMGNAFAAFPLMAIGVGLPVLVTQYHADPAPLAALGMLAGYCGTLLTPMAANFNVVPVALLRLRDQHAVIKAQAGTALPLFACNLLLLILLT